MSSSVQRLLFGTHTSGVEQNYLMIAELRIPSDDAEIDIRKYEEDRGEQGAVILHLYLRISNRIAIADANMVIVLFLFFRVIRRFRKHTWEVHNHAKNRPRWRSEQGPLLPDFAHHSRDQNDHG